MKITLFIIILLSICFADTTAITQEETRTLVIYPIRDGTFIEIDGEYRTLSEANEYTVSKEGRHIVELSKNGTPYYSGAVSSFTDTLDYRKYVRTTERSSSFNDIQFENGMSSGELDMFTEEIWWGIAGTAVSATAVGFGMKQLSDAGGYEDAELFTGMLLFFGGSAGMVGTAIAVGKRRSKIVEQGTYSKSMNSIASATSVTSWGGLIVVFGGLMTALGSDEYVVPVALGGFSLHFLSQLAFGSAVLHFSRSDQQYSRRSLQIVPTVSSFDSYGLTCLVTF